MASSNPPANVVAYPQTLQPQHILRVQVLLARSGSLLLDVDLASLAGSSASRSAAAGAVSASNAEQLAALAQSIRQLGNELGGAGPLQAFRIECPVSEQAASGSRPASSSSAAAAGSSLPTPSHSVDVVCVALEPHLVAMGYTDGGSAAIPHVQHRLHAMLRGFQEAYGAVLEEEVYPQLGTKGIGDAALRFRRSLGGEAGPSASGTSGGTAVVVPSPLAQGPATLAAGAGTALRPIEGLRDPRDVVLPLLVSG